MSGSKRTGRRIGRIDSVLDRKQPDLLVVMENVHDPHNISAVLRSCDAVGVLEVCIIQTIPVNPLKWGKRSSASAEKWILTRHFEDVPSCFTYLKNKGCHILTTFLEGNATSLYELDLTIPVALVFGNEHDGISNEARDLADGNFNIPQSGMIESLNISVACAVSLYEAFRQRNSAGFYDHCRLDDGLRSKTKAEWLKK